MYEPNLITLFDNPLLSCVKEYIFKSASRIKEICNKKRALLQDRALSIYRFRLLISSDRTCNAVAIGDFECRNTLHILQKVNQFE